MTIYIIEIQKSDSSFPSHRGYYREPADAVKAVDNIIEYWQKQWARGGSHCTGLSSPHGIKHYGRMLVSNSGLFVRVQVLEFVDAMASPDFSDVNPQDEIQSLKGTPDPVRTPSQGKRKGE
jgi:hypothetical protein